MDADKIINSLSRKGFSQTLIADVLECSPSLISKVIHRKATSVRIAQAIAKLLQRPVLQVFPEYELLLQARIDSDDDKKQRIRKLLDSN